MQVGLAAYMQDPAPYLELPAFYQRKRDLFAQGLQQTRLKLLPTTGTYFQCVDISDVTDLNEADFLPVDGARAGRGRHSAVCVLRGRFRSKSGALLLCQEERNLAGRAGASARKL